MGPKWEVKRKKKKLEKLRGKRKVQCDLSVDFWQYLFKKS